MGIQYAMGGIAAAGLAGTFYSFKAAPDGGQIYLIAAGASVVVSLIVLAVVYLRFGKPVLLRQTAEGVQRVCGDHTQTITYDRLTGFRAKWTDVMRNGVYQYTHVRFGFSSIDPSETAITHDASASYQTLKFEELQAFQDETAAVVAQHMADELEQNGRVAWTPKLAIRRDGLELIKKAGAPPEVVGFDRVSQWKVDEGVFKLGVDDSRRPVLVEQASEWNFYPGLLLFTQLCDATGSRSILGEEAHVTIG
jgi:hypothetical protein